MAVLIDPPLWPAHGTHFSHLVSDRSLEELHAFAARLGLSPRAFDEDHYDVAAAVRPVALQRGAEEVSAHELTRRLRASGLRIPSRERPRRIRAGLLRSWDQLLPTAPELGRELLSAWEGAERGYHSSVHLLEVLEAVRRLAPGAGLGPEDLRAAQLAAWFHDAVYTGAAGQDEHRSAAWAEQALGPWETGRLPAGKDERVGALVRATTAHARAQSTDPAWPVLHDADLAILATDPARYGRYRQAVRREYAQVPEQVFAQRRAAVLQELLAAEPMYLTELAQQEWAPRARAQVSAEIALLQGRGCPRG